MAQSRTVKKKETAIGYFGPSSVVLICSFALAMLGITILFSASLPLDSDQPYRFIEKQALWMFVTTVVGLIILRVDLEWIRKYVWVGYGICLLALVAVLIEGIGTKVNGSRSWIRVGPIGIQVAEFAKIGLIFALAHYFSLIRRSADTFWKGFVYPCLLIGAVLVLILLQTDLGTALVIAGVGVCMLFLAGTRLTYLIPSMLLGVTLVVAGVYHDTERWSRLTAFMDMEGQKTGDAYQVWQARLAFGSGGEDGVGLGNGRQQLRSLPEAHNDFIFAIVGEELGLYATLSAVSVYLLLFIAVLVHLRRAPNSFQYLLVWGCILTITIQAVMNLGVVTGCLPTTGLPLPFISYGGSNFLIMGICIAVILNTSFAWKAPALKQSKRKLKEI